MLAELLKDADLLRFPVTSLCLGKPTLEVGKCLAPPLLNGRENDLLMRVTQVGLMVTGCPGGGVQWSQNGKAKLCT